MKVNVIKTNKINIQDNGFVIKNGVLESCHIETGKVVIPEGVITISPRTFANRYMLEEVVIPEGVVEIGDGAFYSCGNLKRVTIPESVKHIGRSAFEDTKLEEARLPETMDYIGADAFNNACIKEVVLPKILKSAGQKVFAMTNLTKVVIPEGFKLREGMFANSRLEEVIFEDKNVAIPDNCFSGCVHLKKINFENISSIGYGAFLKCKSLKSVTLLENIKSIESHAFYGSGIRELFIENANVLKEKSAFELCNELKSVVVNVCGKEIVKIPERTFAQCRALADVKFTGSTKLIVKIDRGAFVDAGIESIELPERLRIIGNDAFLGSMLKSIVIPRSVTYIGNKAFARCRSLSGSVEIPDDAEIGAECFRECTGICEVILPKGCDRIKQGTFCSCENLENVKNIENVSVIEADTFYMCMKLKTLDLSNVKSIGECAFLNAGLTGAVLKSLTSDGLGKCAFAGCVDIKEADLSESSLKHLPDEVFGGINARIILPDCIEWFGRECLSLTHINEVKIAGSARIDEHAFSRADICHLIFDKNIRAQISETAFADTKIKELDIPDCLYEQYKSIWDKIE